MSIIYGNNTVWIIMSLSVKGVEDLNRRPLDYGEPHGERSDQLS